MPETPILDLENVVKQYDAPGGGAATAILRGITLSVAAGDALAIVGPSGSGKSTLLNIMGTLDRPTSGRVRLEGRDLADLGDEQLAALRNRRIGFVFQLHHLLPQCTALENVLVPTLAPGARDADVARPARPARPAVAVSAPPAPRPDKSETRPGGPAVPHEAQGESAEDRARRLLERVGLGERLDYRPGQLSGGERQRVAVARALINRPALLLADEPTGSLDRAAAEDLAELLAKLNREEGLTLVVVTHSPALASRTKRQLELRDGQLQPRQGRTDL
ncbi:MAG: ABC transporter ATP-binding protein [Planctomycetes bacterium]|nr:ABC transporter ATP-binding protein [Planctomycetota bacterium]